MTKPLPDILRRPRRNRRSAGIRNLLAETAVTPGDLVAPLFIKNSGASEDIGALPGCRRLNATDLLTECEALLKLGIQAVALFPCIDPAAKNSTGTEALRPDNLINNTVRKLKKSLPELTVITDVALDPYTDHGHDGLLNAQGDVDNDSTVEVLARMAVLQAEAGVDYVAPSDMMDGRVRAIRQALDEKALCNTGILSYSAKFASAYYGPFRDAVGSNRPTGSYLDKKTYQLNPANTRESILDALLDEEEGADILMVKPAGPYLDILAELRRNTLLPLAAYQVSGEYAQIHAAAQRGWLDLNQAMAESLLAIKRAGADLIFTYFAKSFAKLWQQNS